MWEVQNFISLGYWPEVVRNTASIKLLDLLMIYLRQDFKIVCLLSPVSKSVAGQCKNVFDIQEKDDGHCNKWILFNYRTLKH